MKKEISVNIPIYKPDLSGNESKYVQECIASTWISSKGKFIEEFETSFSHFTQIKYAASVCNGTVALHVALEALGIGEGDEVIVPTLTYIASVNAIRYTGAKPVFVDSLSDTWQMNPHDIEKKITEKTKAILVVHLYGQASEMDTISSIAKKNNLRLIEDCAEAIGTEYKGKHVGNFGDIATFSFFGNKTITTGEGGMVMTSSPDIISKVRHLKGQGLAENREYWHDIIGYNYRMTNLCAAIGCAQLERVDSFLRRKREIAKLYTQYLDNSYVICHSEQEKTKHSFWMFSILTGSAESREPLRRYLANAGIETRPLFYPINTMPMYEDGIEFPVANDIASRGINLPSWPGLTDDNIAYIANKILDFGNNNGK